MWIAEDNPAAADALLTTAMATARRIQARPKLGRVRLDLAPERYRFWSLRGFRISWFTTLRQSRQLSFVSCTSPAICRLCSTSSP
jgi:plasmid stabilization system protein ParE